MQLAPHSEVYARPAQPELNHVSSRESAEAFRALSRQVANVIATVEDTREMLLGSFDILMSRTGQRTNDVMKDPTIAAGRDPSIVPRRRDPRHDFDLPFFYSPTFGRLSA